MAKSVVELWEECLKEIEALITPSQFQSFFKPIVLKSFDKSSGTLVLQVPSIELAKYLDKSFFPIFNRVLPRKFGQITIKYLTPTPQQEPKAEPSSAPKEKEDQPKLPTNLNPHYTFNTYVEGKSNRLARSVGLNMAEHPNNTTFNPMFIFGPSGCGKTHLAHAMGNKVVEIYPKKKVLYVPAREFQRQYIDSVLTKETNSFIGFYQQFDMLIVDDVQEWESKEGTTNTFFHIFNYLFLNRKLIILIADRTPMELRNIDERILTRFSQGIPVELEKPNHALCVDILKAKIRRDGLVIPDKVVEYIAQNSNGSVRDLEGIINSLLAHSIFIQGDIDLALAEKVVNRLKRDTPQKYDVPQILTAVCQHFNVHEEDVLGKSRKKEFVQARQIAMYFSHTVGKVSINRIGRLIGNRDHSTVKHSIDKTVKLLEKDKAFAAEMKAIEKEIKGGNRK